MIKCGRNGAIHLSTAVMFSVLIVLWAGTSHSFDQGNAFGGLSASSESLAREASTNTVSALQSLYLAVELREQDVSGSVDTGSAQFGDAVMKLNSAAMAYGSLSWVDDRAIDWIGSTDSGIDYDGFRRRYEHMLYRRNLPSNMSSLFQLYSELIMELATALDEAVGLQNQRGERILILVEIFPQLQEVLFMGPILSETSRATYQ